MGEETDGTANAESTSDDAGVSESAESTSEEQGEVEGAEESEAEGDGESEAEEEGESEGESESGDGEEGVEAAGDDDGESEEYRKLAAKFNHITNERDKRAAIAKAWWDKNNYASQVTKRAKELERELAELKAKQPKDEEKPPVAPPDLERATLKIQALYQRDEALKVRLGEVGKELNDAYTEVVIAEDRLKDYGEDDDRKVLAQQRVRQAKLELKAGQDRYAGLKNQRDDLNERMEQALAEKDWIDKFHKDQAQRQTSEQKRTEHFNQEFPEQVRSLAKAAAEHIKVKLDTRLEASLWRHVNRAVQADIREQYVDVDIEEIPIPQMVLDYTREWAEDLDLAKRQTFSKLSKEKLGVVKPSGKPAGKAAAPGRKPALPASSRPAVSPALLSRDTSPAMARARQILVQRFGG